MRLTATAYCHAGTTAAGTRTHTGIVAADPRILPVGSVVEIVQPDHVAGIYTVMDTGSAVKGRTLDIFMPSCEHAIKFGRRPVRVNVLRRGWGPEGPRRRSLKRASLHHEGTKDTTRTNNMSY